ncbi:trichothecene 3-O-acetyltransferase [Colletotrichum tofieldiae]|nr:trichothecene 3-O-acetyltransferase [Colletotrichum tofieldiae]
MSSIDFTPHVALSPLDQIAPRIYVRSVFIFNVDRKFGINKALCHIADRFHASLLRWPFLTGQVRPATYSIRPNELELDYDLDENRADPSQRPDLFTYQFCDRLGGSAYEKLKARGMPPSVMEKDILSLSPNHPKPGEPRLRHEQARFEQHNNHGSDPEGPPAVCVLFKIQNSTLRMLHGLALTELRNKHGPDAFVSMVDTLSALIWVHTTRARLPHLDLTDKTCFTTAADARIRLSPAFSADSWGNVYTQTSASTSVRDLVQAWSGMNMDSTPAVVAAAWRIRNAVSQVNTPSYIPSRIALAASLADPTMESAAFRRALQPDHAGLGCSVWTHMGADVDFGIPAQTARQITYARRGRPTTEA